MDIVLLSSTQFGYECLREGVLPVETVNVRGILTTPSTIEISYAEEPVEISQYADFREVESSIDGDVVVMDKVSAGAYHEQIERWQPDFILALGWYYLIPTSVRERLPRGCAGIHASLLPRYRGGAPIPWTIINGEDETGVTFFYLEDGVDTGDIIGQTAFPIAFNDTCATVYDKATAASIELLREYLPALAAGTAPRIPQPEEEATQFPQRSPEDGEIDWTWSTRRIHDFIRAQTKPYPGAFTFLGDQKLTIWRARPANQASDLKPGEFSRHPWAGDHGHLLVGTGNGSLTILDHEMPGAAALALDESSRRSFGPQPVNAHS